MRIRPVDVRSGDVVYLDETIPTPIVILHSALAEPGDERIDMVVSNRRHEWWITYIFLDEDGKVTKHSRRHPPREMNERVYFLIERSQAGS